MNAPSFNLNTGDAVRVGYDWWEVLHRSRNEVALRLSGTLTTRTYSNREFVDAYFRNEIEILRKALGAGLPKGVDDMIARTFETIPHQWQQEALRRLDFVQITDRLFKRFRGRLGWAMRPGKGEGYEKAALIAAHMRQKRQADRLGIRRTEVGKETVSASTLRAWYTRWRKAGHALGALVPLHEKKGASAPRMDEIVVRIIADVVRSRYLTLERLPLGMVYQLICAELIRKNEELKLGDPSFKALPRPSEMAVRRWIKEYLTPYEITFAREGSCKSGTRSCIATRFLKKPLPLVRTAKSGSARCAKRWRSPKNISVRPGNCRLLPRQLLTPRRRLPVTRPNQVWAMDITYIPMARGFVYLAAVVDWFSRKVPAWRLSITMDTAFCIEAVEDAMARFGKPEIFNTDQGSQFTSHEFTGLLIAADIRISMDGKGAWRDNVFVERLWKSVKCEEVYLRAYASVSEARASIGRYLDFFNTRRPHQGLGRQTPDQAYFNALLPIPAAA